MLVFVLSVWLVQSAKVSLLYCMARCGDMMTWDTCAVDHVVRNRGLQYQSAFQSCDLIGWLGVIRVGLGLI